MTLFNRREFMKTGGTASAAMAVSLSLLPATSALATEDQKAKAQATIKELTGGKEVKKGTAKLIAPTIAENGAVVPITVDAGSGDVVSIALMVDENPNPMVFNAKVDGSVAGKGMISARIRMMRTSTIRTFVTDSKGNVYGDSKTVKVTIGGCG